jgi:hypothetical protein
VDILRIVDTRETVVPIKSDICNASIDFGQMTVSVLAPVADAMGSGASRLSALDFNSSGRYGPRGVCVIALFRGLGQRSPACSSTTPAKNLDRARV